MPKLTWTVQGATKSVDVTDSCSIGRLETNTVPLPDETGASRRHCQILKIPSGYELSDLGSTNGTKVNGQAVKRHKLKDGDEIRIGETALRWSEGSGAAAEDEVVLEGDVQLEEPAAAAAPARGGSGGGTSEQCYLVVAGGPKDGEKIVLEKKRITFGRNPKNTNVLGDDAGVSGYHCEVVREGGAYVLRDLGSTNGTFVDGEQVTEIALQHGNRIRLGQTRLVFVDPTVSDFEKAMSAVEDLGSEWGMLRAEMDMTRVQQARRSQMVAIGFLVVVLAGAGYVAIAHPEMITGGEKPPTPVAGNQFPGDFSFEAGSGAWAALPGSPAQGRYAGASDGSAAQGKAFYAVSREGVPGRAAAVAAGEKDRIRINPLASYAFGAKVRTKGDALACVRVAWLSGEGAVVGESASDLTSSESWTEARGVVAQPPRDAVAARLELVNAASGAAYFDDVFFVAADARPTAPELKGGEVTLAVSADGQVALRRGSQTFLSDGSFVAGALREGEGSRRADRVGSRKGTSVSGGGASAKVGAQAWDAVRGAWAACAATFGVAEDRYVTIAAEIPEDAAFVATLPREIAAEGLGVRTEGGNFFRLTEPRAVEKVRSVTIGERSPFRIESADDAAPSWRLDFARAADGTWTVAIGAAGGSVSLRCDTDGQKIRDETTAVEQRARDAKQSRRLGRAILAFRELAAKLPQGSQAAAAASKEADDLESSGATRLAAIQKGRASAAEFQDDVQLRAIEAEAVSLAQSYEGHAIGETAAKEVAAAGVAIAGRSAVLRDRRAVPMLARADDFRDREDLTLARAIYKGIVAAWPGTNAAKKAAEELQKLPAGK